MAITIATSAATTQFLLNNTAKAAFTGPQFSSKQQTRIVIAKSTQTETQTPSSVSKRRRRPQNVDGDFFVDNACIDCDTCRWMAPETFNRADSMSAVYKQPSSEDERLKALQALLSCPTSSIHVEHSPSDIKNVQKTFPLPISEKIEGVYHCGYHSEKSYGATTYFIVHPEGNILVDSPRYTEQLARTIEFMGGARYMFLTHKDDVADHDKWAKRLNCERVMHAEEVTNSTEDIEIKLEGSGPWSLGEDFTLVHTPGHSSGSVCLLYKSKKILFTGDHLLMEDGSLSILERYNSCSVPMQLNSVEKLIELKFEWILPGHGRRVDFGDVEEKNSVLKAFLASKATLR